MNNAFLLAPARETNSLQDAQPRRPTMSVLPAFKIVIRLRQKSLSLGVPSKNIFSFRAMYDWYPVREVSCMPSGRQGEIIHKICQY